MSESLSDQTLQLQRWLACLDAGDDAALNELLEHFSGRLASLAHTMLLGFPQVRGREETADVVQNASLRLIRALHDLVRERQASGSTDPFRSRDLLGLAALQIRRELLDLAKHYRRQRQPRFAEQPGETTDDGRGAPEGNGCDTWDPQHVADWAEFHEQAARLPEKDREVFDLLWYHGLPQAEAALLLNVDVRTVKRRWQRARLALYSALHGKVPGS